LENDSDIYRKLLLELTKTAYILVHVFAYVNNLSEANTTHTEVSKVTHFLKYKGRF